MSDAESEDDVKLYNALERRQKQPVRMFVSLDSDNSDSDSDEAWEVTPPSPKRRRKAAASPPSSGKKPAAKNAKQIEASLDSEREDSEDTVADGTPKKSAYEDLLTPAELAAERSRKARMELEIAQRLALDNTLAQARAAMSKASTLQTQAVIELSDSDSVDDSDDEVEIVQPTHRSKSATAKSAEEQSASATAAIQETFVRGERIKLQIRSNGAAMDEVAIHMNDPFDLLYVSFCDLHGLPRTAVKMVLDGEELSLTDTPAASDLESGDLIDATVDFSQREQDKVKRYLRLRLVVFGKRAEVFKIDARSKVEKLHASFCAKHGIETPEDVTMSVNGLALDLDEVIEFYGLIDGEEVSVEISNFVDPAAIPLQLRFGDGSTAVERMLVTDKVQALLEKIANLKQCAASAVTLRIDGENMAPALALGYYDLEGDELIDVKLDQ